MELTKEYRMALAELNVIILNMSSELQEKLPYELKTNIYKEMDKNHWYEINDEMLPQTKVLLAELLKQYLANDKEKKKFSDFDKYCEKLIEKQKSKKYNKKDLFAKSANDQDKLQANNQMLEYSKKENFFKTLINKIKRKILKK